MPDATHPLDIVIKKRDGAELSRGEIERFVRAVVRSGESDIQALATEERVTEAQIASFLMAVFQRGLSARELADLTQAMRVSGEVLQVRTPETFVVDKHSTGGVGDKTSLLIAPIVAAAGQVLRGRRSTGEVAPVVPMISGRSLGHTGGTLDKLETIPGFRTQMPLSAMGDVLRRCGAVMVGQTPRLVPADRILYALRDHTGTVESPFLITASIMSKKLAEDLQGLVLDVKVGSGAFMPTYEASRELARLMVETGERAGTRTVALLTGMEEPLGRFAGNWVEVWECVDVLRGVRHPMSRDLVDLTCGLAGWMLHLAGMSETAEAGAALADSLLRTGAAYRSWLAMVEAQGGDVRVFQDPAAFHRSAYQQVLRAPRDGFLAAMDCKQVGWAVQRLGAGRARPGAPVSAHAGVEVHAKLGDLVREGQPVFTLFSEDEGSLKEPLRMLEATLGYADAPPMVQPLVREVVRVADPTS